MGTTPHAEVEAFLDRYGEALAGGDLAGIAACYTLPALVAGDGAAIPIAEPGQVEAAFAGAADAYRAQGLVGIRAELRGVDRLTPNLLLADVRWAYLDQGGGPEALQLPLSAAPVRRRRAAPHPGSGRHHPAGLVAGGGLRDRLGDRPAGAEQAALDQGDAEDHDQAAHDQADRERLAEDEDAGGHRDQGDQVGDQGGDGGAALLEGAVVEQVGVAGAEGAEQDQAEGGPEAEVDPAGGDVDGGHRGQQHGAGEQLAEGELDGRQAGSEAVGVGEAEPVAGPGQDHGQGAEQGAAGQVTAADPGDHGHAQ